MFRAKVKESLSKNNIDFTERDLSKDEFDTMGVKN